VSPMLFVSLSGEYSAGYHTVDQVPYSEHKQTRRRKRMSHISEDRNSDKERYIREAAIDIVIAQGI
jgi:hypothetical protein